MLSRAVEEKRKCADKYIQSSPQKHPKALEKE